MFEIFLPVWMTFMKFTNSYSNYEGVFRVDCIYYTLKIKILVLNNPMNLDFTYIKCFSHIPKRDLLLGILEKCRHWKIAVQPVPYIGGVVDASFILSHFKQNRLVWIKIARWFLSRPVSWKIFYSNWCVVVSCEQIFQSICYITSKFCFNSSAQCLKLRFCS